jgi:hypothetical protein
MLVLHSPCMIVTCLIFWTQDKYLKDVCLNVPMSLSTMYEDVIGFGIAVEMSTLGPLCRATAYV